MVGNFQPAQAPSRLRQRTSVAASLRFAGRRPLFHTWISRGGSAMRLRHGGAMLHALSESFFYFAKQTYPVSETKEQQSE